jgi:D-serine deaminase-like pyridoxal phosphate-dependent protein
MTIDQLLTPALLLDLDILEHNLKRMQEHALKHRVSLRPHIKTHKCIEIAKKQQALGAKGITVSTFYEAEQFAAAGFNDITWALPLPPVYTEKAVQLARKTTIRLTIDSVEARLALVKVAASSATPIHVWLKVDCGYHRAGVDPSSTHAKDLARSLAESKELTFDGILTHAGHSYLAKSKKEILDIAEQEQSIMVDFAQKLRENKLTVPVISIGSTPTATLVEKLDGINEIRPGNYAFNDYTQVQLGVCDVNDCALTVLASIISHQPGAQHFITDAGALALSKDFGATHIRNDMGLGILYEDYDRKRLFAHLDVQVQSLSQEHGKIIIDRYADIEGKFKVGERVRILEHHSCLTAANFDRYYVIRGNDVVDEWKIMRGRV